MLSTNRPWPAPSEPWVMVQKWRDLLFAHWPVSVDVLREFVPPQLPIDTYNRVAWLGITPFTLDGLRARWIPPIPKLSRFPEINVRTYVTLGGKPGVYFFSLDAGSRLAVLGARLTYGLPYFFTRARVDTITDGVDYRCTRDDPQGHPATFRAQYRPIRRVFHAEPGSLEYFLTERYCLYVVRAENTVWRAEIDHAPWPLQLAEADIRANTMATAAGLSLTEEPMHLHFSRFLDVKIWRPELVPENELNPQHR